MLNAKIITPIGLYKEMSAKIINIVTIDGQRGILANHIPLVTMLEISLMTIEEDNSRETYTIGGGMFYLDDENNASILVDSIENINDIDVERALKAKEKAENDLANYTDGKQMLNAEVALRRALNRIGAKQV